MGTVTVGTTDYTIMGTLDGAKEHIQTVVGPGADAWNALATDSLKSKFLVAATRYLYRQQWAGTPTVADQVTAFPRDGLSNCQTGEALGDAVTPANAILAEYEMAAILAGDSAAYAAANAGSNTKRLKAGPVEVEYFTGSAGPNGGASKMPPVVMDLIGCQLSSSSGLTRSTVSGDCSESHFDNCGSVYPYTRNGPF